MSLAFLSKKSWHTTNVSNVEKVWIAEQKADKEQKKLAELQKQLDEERQVQELRKLQGKEITDSSLDWMYQGPASQNQILKESAEEYLLGKIYKSKEQSSAKAALSQNEFFMDANTSGKPKWETKLQSKNEAFVRVHEDPMFAIMQQEKKTRENILSNPLKLAKLREQVESQLMSAENDKKSNKSENKKDKKREKEHKREKSHKHKSNRRHDESSDDSESDAVDRRDVKKHRYDSRDRRDSRDRHQRGDSRDRRRHDDSRDHDSRRGTHEANDSSRKRSNDGNEKYPSQRHSDSRRESSESRQRKPERKVEEVQERQKKEGYGLIKGTTQSNADSNDGYFGPKRDVVEKRLQQEKEELQHRKQQSERRQLTEEERLKHLEEMEANASQYESQKANRLLEAQSNRQRELSESTNTIVDPKFLNSMRAEVYTNSNVSMEERIKQNKHYSQRSADLDGYGFMKNENK